MLDLLKRLLGALLDRYGRGGQEHDVPAPFTLGNDLASRIVKTMVRNGYTVDANPGHCNIVYVEGLDPDGTPNDNKPNQFNDLRVVIRFDGKIPKIVGKWEATTEPSRRWTMRPMNPKGAARIKFGQYTAWRVGVHNGHHEALVQVGGPVTVHRDLNKDFERDGDQLEAGFFGINQHGGYDLPRNDLGNSSAGCLVGRTMAGHREFMEIIKSDPRYVDDDEFVFTAAIMPASDVR
jgi:hypothetical protein